jgi:hypothetical protein
VCPGPLELIARQPDSAGNLLSSLILDAEEERPERITAFNDALRPLPPEMRSRIVTFIREQEAEGWLADYNKVGVLAQGWRVAYQHDTWRAAESGIVVRQSAEPCGMAGSGSPARARWRLCICLRHFGVSQTLSVARGASSLS